MTDLYAHERVLDRVLARNLRPGEQPGASEVADYLELLAKDIPLAGETIHDSLTELLDGELADIARLAAQGDDAAIGSIVGAVVRSEALKALRARKQEAAA